MNQLVTGVKAALAIGLCFAVTACSDGSKPGSDQTSTVKTTTSTTAPTAPSTSTSASSSPSTTATTTPSTSSTSTAPKKPVVDQSSPEGAMTAWLGAVVSGDSKAVCALMASGGRPITSIKGADEGCAKLVAPTIKDLKKVRSAFAGLRITGASIKGDSASFDSSTTRPVLAAKVINGLKAVKVAKKWYVSATPSG